MANCKVFTSAEYATELLDQIGYCTNLFGKRVLENSCGEGSILSLVVDRYIAWCESEQLEISSIRAGLERDIVGVEIDRKTAEVCCKKLDSIAYSHGIKAIDWKIIVDDYLNYTFDNKFDFILSNPPYITYRDIPKNDQSFIRQKFTSCKNGKFDYYYAFIEKSVCNELAENGKAAFIVPSSMYKNVFASNLRNLIKLKITKVYDYTSMNKFPDATTSSTIGHFEDKGSTSLIYYDVKNERQLLIDKTKLSDKWIFEIKDKTMPTIRFGDYFDVHNSIATLCNEAFILEDYFEKDGFYISSYNENDRVESSLVKPAFSLKNERRKTRKKISIIYPYSSNSSNVRFEKKYFEETYPYACAHLSLFKNKLDARAIDKQLNWFEYGRFQSIPNVLNDKLVLPVIFSQNISVARLDENAICIAGMFVTKKKESIHTLDEAKVLLEGKEFRDYLNVIGISTTGMSKRVSVRDIENYSFRSWP